MKKAGDTSRWASGEAKGAISFRNTLVARGKIAAVLVLVLLSSANAFTWKFCGRRAPGGRTGLLRSIHTEAEVIDREDGYQHSSRRESTRPSEAMLKAMELWFDETGVDRQSGNGTPSVKLRHFPGRGIGLEAMVELDRDSIVASIPHRVCLSSAAEDAPARTLRARAHAIMSSILPSVAAACYDEGIAFETDVVAVTLQLFFEHAAGARSAFAPWMVLLTGQGHLNLPALWPVGDLDGLKGTLVLQEVKGCLSRAAKEREIVVAATKKGVRVTEETGQEMVEEGDESLEIHFLNSMGKDARPTYAEWLHARCTVQSRAYRVGPKYLLIPLVDFANHDDDVAFAVCPGDGVFTSSDEVVFAADRSYRPGQEICTSYGDMDNAKRLFSFGFVTLSQPYQHPGSSPADLLALPTEAFCDVAFEAKSTDRLRKFKQGVLQEHATAESGASFFKQSAVFTLTQCRPSVSELVEGPARSFVEAIMPVMRFVALTLEELASDEDLKGLLLPLQDSLNDGVECDVVHDGKGAVIALKSGEGSRVLARLGSRISLENERKALRVLQEQCSSHLSAIDLNSSDVEALRAAVSNFSNEAGVFSASSPRALLCATVRVGEAIAWYSLLEACKIRTDGSATGRREEQTWAAWVSSHHELIG